MKDERRLVLLSLESEWNGGDKAKGGTEMESGWEMEGRPTAVSLKLSGGDGAKVLARDRMMPRCTKDPPRLAC